MDYVLPDWLARALAKPSERTQMETSIVGILVMMLGSLFVASYFIINGDDMSNWVKLAIGASEFGIMSFQWSLLSTTYQTYRNYKLEMGYYPVNYKLKLKLHDAKQVSKDLAKTIREVEKENEKVLVEKENENIK